MAKIRKIKNNSETIFPVTITDAVINSNGQTLTTLLKNKAPEVSGGYVRNNDYIPFRVARYVGAAGTGFNYIYSVIPKQSDSNSSILDDYNSSLEPYFLMYVEREANSDAPDITGIDGYGTIYKDEAKTQKFSPEKGKIYFCRLVSNGVLYGGDVIVYGVV